MSQQSSIEWTDATWNPVRGCIKVSPGCAHCYAETFAERFRGMKGHPYEQGFDVRLVPEKLHEPFRWKKPRRVFVNSMSDLFQDGVPDAYIRRCFDVMAQVRRHTFQVLTKRPARMQSLVPTFAKDHTAPDGSGWPLPNVWLGVSVENQHFADERIPLLLQTPAAVRFISAEPLLGPVDLSDQLLPWLDWVIVGGESGPRARPCCLSWVRNIVHDSLNASVPVFVKQLGARPYETTENGHEEGWPIDRLIDISSRKGGDPAEWEPYLRMREFPA